MKNRIRKTSTITAITKNRTRRIAATAILPTTARKTITTISKQKPGGLRIGSRGAAFFMHRGAMRREDESSLLDEDKGVKNQLKRSK